MHQRLLEVTQDLDTARQALLRGYDPVRLYNLRVAMRRIRSILKQIGSEEARKLRKAWGRMASVTGPARDWDVFITSAENLLGLETAGEFTSFNGERISVCRKSVLQMIESDAWARHWKDWNQFLEKADEAPLDPEQAGAALAIALANALRRHKRAMKKGSDKRWHKYRIAVKEVRYVAEANTGIDGMEALVATCKPLQTLLGDWHDTVVQTRLLAELPPAEIHGELTDLIRDRKAALLSDIRSEPPLSQPEW